MGVQTGLHVQVSDYPDPSPSVRRPARCDRMAHNARHLQRSFQRSAMRAEDLEFKQSAHVTD